MDATVISNSNSTPKYRTFEHKDTCEKGIEIKDWRVTTRKDRIYNSEEIDRYYSPKWNSTFFLKKKKNNVFYLYNWNSF